MANRTAEQYIKIYEAEDSEIGVFKTLWQDTADLVYPHQNQILTVSTAGETKTDDIYDSTAITDSVKMTSGLSSSLIPAGQLFFGLRTDSERMDLDNVRRMLQRVTEIAHEEMFSSNFMLQLNETLRGLITFGTGNIYSDFSTNLRKLFFKDYFISTYCIRENEAGYADAMMCKFPLTSQQILERFGDNSPDKIKAAMGTAEGEMKKWYILHFVEPRRKRNLTKRTSINMPYESVYICVDTKEIIDEGGYEQFPFAVPRWMKSSNEKYGRGVGTEILPVIRSLQQMMKDFIECGNKWNNPPLEVLESFEGKVRVTPGAQNIVQTMNSIRELYGTTKGSFPVTKDMLTMMKEDIHGAFMMPVFQQLASLTGDRRTTIEIMERINEGMQMLAQPIGRLQSELFDPLISRIVSLLYRNGRLPKLPVELTQPGVKINIEYKGRLALALRDQQAKGFQQFLNVVVTANPMFLDNPPTDLINVDSAFRRLSEAMGVNVNDLESPEVVQSKRTARAQAQQAQQAMMAAQTAGDVIKNTGKKPEEGSPASDITNGLKEMSNAS